MGRSRSAEAESIREIRNYWDHHPLGSQFITDPGIELGSKAYFDHIRPLMTARFPWIVDLIEKRGPEVRGKRFLEIGSGMGFDSIEWAKFGPQLTAIDLSENSLKFAQINIAQSGSRASLAAGNALELPFPSDSFDFVYSRGVLHHTGNTKKAVDEVWRVLRPLGWAFICHLYRKNSWKQLLSRLTSEPIEFIDGEPPQTRFHSAAEIRDMFGRFQRIELHLHHYRALGTVRTGLKANLFNKAFVPIFNLIPERMARNLAHKISVYARK